MAHRPNDPLFGAAPDRVLLSKAPLVRVLCQVTFPSIVKISEQSYISDFQEAIRHEYPLFQGEIMQGVELSLAGPSLQHRQVDRVVWRFLDVKSVIRVSLTTDAITLETAQYVSRDDFLARLKFILGKLVDTINPSHVQRVGFRYVDRLQGDENLSALPSLIQPELLNVVRPDLMQHIDISMTEMVATTAEGNLIARYGLAPANYSHDPEMAPPVGEKSWVLDVDSFSTSCAGQTFDTNMLCSELDKVAARAYSFFRWSVTESFLKHFGASE
jgi:uncharacterized protein (TIGR04255 family)